MSAGRGFTRLTITNQRGCLITGCSFWMAAEAVIPPLVAVMVGSNYDQTRGRDLGCYEPYLDFLADELMPWARQRYHIMHDPADHAGRYEPRRVGDSLCRIAMVSTSIGLLATIRPRPLGGVWLFIG
jgi:hypothetical protein